MVERFVSNELEGMWMGPVMAELGYSNTISPVRPRKTTRNISHSIHYNTKDSNQTLPELMSEGLLLEPTWLVSSKNITIRHCVNTDVSTISLYTTPYYGDLKKLHVSVVYNNHYQASYFSST